LYVANRTKTFLGSNKIFHQQLNLKVMLASSFAIARPFQKRLTVKTYFPSNFRIQRGFT